ncbi:hypothetical protein JHS3_19130 [Jeongeupia sp. HS-3]|nr:hypothetical protein JHS3_19130 [Jeongeupia sp. HS-3]
MTITVGAPTLIISPASGSALNGAAGTAYSQSFTASGGTAPHRLDPLSVDSGTMPTGLSFNTATGTLSGTPTSAGTVTFKVKATDSSTGAGPHSLTGTYTLTIAAPTITVSPSTLPNPAVGTAYSQTVSASGGVTPYTYAVTSGSLPAGLTLNSSSGAITGMPTAAGSFSFTVTATDANGFTKGQGYSVTVGAPSIVVSPASLPSANVASSYNQTITAAGGTAPYTFAVTAGAVPHGMTLSGSGVLSGTPTQSGPTNFTITATDSSGGTQYTGSSAYTLTINAPTLIMSPASGSALNGAAGTAYSQSFAASGGTAPHRLDPLSVDSGAMPTGLSFNTATGTLSGTPTSAGTVTFKVKATDSSTGAGPHSLTGTYTLTIAAPTITVSPSTLPNPAVGTAYSQTVSASGGVAAYAYAVSNGSLPSGMNLNAGSGAITGTPTAAGSFSFTVTATDANGFTKGQGYSVTVAAPSIAVAPASLPAGQVGSAYSQTASASGGTAPYVFGISAGSLPTGLSLDPSSGAITGTPTAVGTFNFTVQATDSTGGGAPFSGSKAYTVTINPLAPVAGALSLTVPYNTAIPIDLAASISGGAASGVTVSTAPGHGTTTVSAAVVTYTPTAGYSGTDSFSYTATNVSGTSVATVSLIVNPQATIAGAVTATVAFNSSNNPIALKLAGGVAVSVAVATAPSHGTASVSGTTISYTPTAGYSGTDRFSYTATNASGQSAPATVDITVNPALPAPQPATTTIASNSGSTVIPLLIDGGPVVSVTVVSPPRHGTLNVTGLGANRKVLASVTDAGSGAPSVSYTPNPGFVGTDSFSYTASNAAGTSAAATVTLQVTPPPPVLAPVSATTVSGAPVTLDVTAGASGGPFTGLALVTPPANGTAEVRGLTIVYTPPPAFAGVVTIGYALSNAWGTTRGTATVTVNARPDPSKDPEVTGLLAAQTDATKRFARAQLDNFNRRLESLHGKGWGDSDFGLSASNFGLHADRDADPELSKRGRSNRLADASGRSKSKVDAGASEASGEANHAARNELAFWIGGGLDFGRRDAVTGQDKFRFSTDGISVGSDYRVNDLLSVGVGGGFSRDVSDVGSNGSKSEGRSGTVALYASLRPTETLFVDGVLGYGWLNFDLDRYITDSGANASGSRNGRQLFGLLAAGYEYRNGSWLVSPYGRLDMMSATLDGYTESAPGVSALTYAGQDVRMSSGKLGVRGETSFDLDFGRLTPRMRVEYQHQFEGSDDAYLAYADLAAYGLGYVAHLAPTQRNQWIIEAGGKIALRGEMTFSLDYSSTLNNSSGYTQAVRLMLGVPF